MKMNKLVKEFEEVSLRHFGVVTHSMDEKELRTKYLSLRDEISKKMTEKTYALTVEGSNGWYCHALFDDFKTAQEYARDFCGTGNCSDWKINEPKFIEKDDERTSWGEW